jgi:2-polyprenyl-3-methyl-5-hydroxy-6-metoxy-1,4-benzoquinol methylase
MRALICKLSAETCKLYNCMKKFHQYKKRSQANKTGWENVSRWYGEHVKEEGNLLTSVVYPAVLKELGDLHGKKLLDIACGEGAFSRLAANAAASVAGFDVAPSLIARAKQSAPRNAAYFVADAENFANSLKNEKFDAAVCVLAIQNIKNFEKVFANASASLKPGSLFVIAMNHPVFRIPRQSAWGWEEERKIQYRRVDAYMSDLTIPIVAHPGEKNSAKTYSFHRPISAYVNALAKYGFAVTGMEELTSNRQSDPGARAKAENRARTEIPMFLVMRATKIN